MRTEIDKSTMSVTIRCCGEAYKIVERDVRNQDERKRLYNHIRTVHLQSDHLVNDRGVIHR